MNLSFDPPRTLPTKRTLSSSEALVRRSAQRLGGSDEGSHPLRHIFHEAFGLVALV